MANCPNVIPSDMLMTKNNSPLAVLSALHFGPVWI